MVRKRGGEALSEDERRREDERVSKIVREYEQQRLSGQAASRRRAERPRGAFVIYYPLMTTDGFLDYLRVAEFSHVRREQLRGRSAGVVEFQPRPGVVPNGDLERQTSRMACTLWIDETSGQVIRMDSYFWEDNERVVQGSSIRIECTLVNDEVWMPSRAELAHRLRFFFGAAAQFVFAIQFTDHKKFAVSTDSAITLPDAQPDHDQPPR